MILISSYYIDWDLSTLLNRSNNASLCLMLHFKEIAFSDSPLKMVIVKFHFLKITVVTRL